MTIEARRGGYVLFEVGPGRCEPILGSMDRVIGQVCGLPEGQGGTIRLNDGEKRRLRVGESMEIQGVVYMGK